MFDSYISREDICSELNIDDATLTSYEEHLELPQTSDGMYHISVGKMLGKVHDLVGQGYKFSEIKTLSMFADQFSDLIPGLSVYADLNPERNLREILIHYQNQIQELSDKEAKYKETILELQEENNKLLNANEDYHLLENRYETLKTEFERLKLELSYREQEITELQNRIEQYEVKSNEHLYEIAKKDSLLNKYQSELSESGPDVPNYAIDVESLLKKKEREINMKHQREIHNLKKQFETAVEKKEKEWLENIRNS